MSSNMHTNKVWSFMQRFKNKSLERYYLINGNFQYWIVANRIFTLSFFLCVITMITESKRFTKPFLKSKNFNNENPSTIILAYENFVFEVNGLALLFAILIACTLLMIQVAGPKNIDLLTFISYLWGQVFHVWHQMYKVTAIADHHNSNACGDSELAVNPFYNEPFEENCKAMYAVGTNNLHLCSVMGALLICSIIVRRLVYRLVAGFVVFAFFLWILRDHPMYCFFASIFTFCWFLECVYDDRNLRFRLLKQMMALENLTVYNRSSRRAQSILNHMIKNVAIGMEESSQSLRQYDKDCCVVTNRVESADASIVHVQNLSSMIVVTSHFTQMQIDIDEGNYKMNMQTISATQLSAYFKRGDPLGMPIETVWGESLSMLRPKPTFELDVDLVNFIGFKALKEARKRCRRSKSILHISHVEGDLILSYVLPWALEVDREKEMHLMSQWFLEHAQNIIVDSINLEILAAPGDNFVVRISCSCKSLEDARSPVNLLPDDLYVVGIDDSAVGRKMLMKLIQKLGAKKAVCLGETLAEVEEAERKILSDHPPHLVFLDQHIQTKDERTLFGTDIALRLRAKGYDGMISIASANASSNDMEQYSELGAIDFVIPKHTSLDMKKAAVLKAYQQRM